MNERYLSEHTPSFTSSRYDERLSNIAFFLTFLDGNPTVLYKTGDGDKKHIPSPSISPAPEGNYAWGYTGRAPQNLSLALTSHFF